jgi:hypothetical protein
MYVSCMYACMYMLHAQLASGMCALQDTHRICMYACIMYAYVCTCSTDVWYVRTAGYASLESSSLKSRYVCVYLCICMYVYVRVCLIYLYMYIYIYIYIVVFFFVFHNNLAEIIF